MSDALTGLRVRRPASSRVRDREVKRLPGLAVLPRARRHAAVRELIRLAKGER